MKITKTALPGVLLLEPPRFGDTRGFFSESWNRKTLAAHGIEIDFVQDNHSLSGQTGTVRGLHFQSPPMRRPSWCAAVADGSLMSPWTSAKTARLTANGSAMS